MFFSEISDINSTRALPNIVAGEVPNFPGIPIQEHSQLIVPPMYNQLWGSQLPPGLMSITWGQMMMPPQQQQQQPPQQQPLIIQRPRPASTATNRDTSTNSSGYGSQMSFNQYNNVSGSPISENNGCKYSFCCPPPPKTVSFTSLVLLYSIGPFIAE